MTPFFTLITPTLQRQSLTKACASVNEQSFTDWQHIVRLDCGGEEVNEELIAGLIHPQRQMGYCGVHHNNGGNTCRHQAWAQASGEWVLYLDDDNHLADPRVLEDIHAALKGRTEKWAIFPIIRLGQMFYSNPPGDCRSDTMNLVLRREVALWPETTAYGSDGVLIGELLVRGVPYAAFPDFRPIGVIPKISFCR